MASEYLIQIVDKLHKKIVSWEPGLEAEAALIDSISKKLLTKQVGIFTTRKQVAAAVKESIEELLLELKRKV